jgi:AbiV family abortive infection protein
LGIPDRAQLISAARHAVHNAAELTEEAELLSRHKRWGRSYVLGVFALEEIGKCVLCAAASSWTDERASDFWADFSSHETKLSYARAWLTISDGQISVETLGAIDTAIRGTPGENQQKMRGLYVDIANGTAISHPRTVTEEQARRITADVRRILDPLLQFTPGDDAYQWAKEEYLDWDAWGEDPLAMNAVAFNHVVETGAQAPHVKKNRKRRRPRRDGTEDTPTEGSPCDPTTDVRRMSAN